MRRLIITLAIGLIALAIGLIIFLNWPSFNFKKQALPTSPLVKSTTAPAADLMEKKIEPISEDRVAGYWIDEITQELYLLKETGEILKIISKATEQVTDQVFTDINEVRPAADGGRALVHFNYPRQSTFAVFNNRDKNITFLPQGTTAAAWHPSQPETLVYLDGAGLKINNLRSKKTSELAKIILLDGTVSWETEDLITISDRPSVFLEEGRWQFNLKTKNLSRIVPDQDFKNYLGPECVTNNQKKLCAVARPISTKAPVIDDYLKNKKVVIDDFYLDNQPLATTGVSPIDAVNLTWWGNNLYFINRYDQQLYRLAVK